MDKDMDLNKAQAFERTEEEVAWDEEFKDDKQTSATSDLTNLVRFAVRLPGAILSNVVPEETARHARAAAREGFLAVRTLVGALADNIEEMLAEPDNRANTTTVKGPPGTWGTGRSATAPAQRGKVAHIEVEETISE